MFHAEFLIDDKDVVKLHYALAGLRVFNVEVKPAVNVKVGRGKKVEEENHGSMADQVTVALRELGKNAHVTRQQIFALAQGFDFRPNSQLIVSLIKRKVIRKRGRGEFTVVAVK